MSPSFGILSSFISYNLAGGAIRVITTSLHMSTNSRMESDATYGSHHYAAASGGSIWITTNTWSGAGTIQAKGNSGWTETVGGSGGRIAVYVLDSSTFSGTVQAPGGNPSVANRVPDTTPASGTVYLSIPDQIFPPILHVPAQATFKHL